MTKEADFKRLVRARAARTGESYQVARRHLRPEQPSPVGPGVAVVEEFERTGIVHLTGVFSSDAAARMRDVVWASWERIYGVRRDVPETWRAIPAWKALPGPKRHPVFGEMLGARLCEVADALIGPGWSAPSGYGNLLASPPDADRWHLPGRDGLWHSDGRYTTPMDPLRSLRVFAVFGDLPPGGGGTLLVEGSHRMVADFVSNQMSTRSRAKEAREACHRSNSWLRELTHGEPDTPGRIERFMYTVTGVDGIPARVVEVCGEPGDVFVCHPWTIHCRPPNAGPGPRFLRSPSLSHRDVSDA